MALAFPTLQMGASGVLPAPAPNVLIYIKIREPLQACLLRGKMVLTLLPSQRLSLQLYSLNCYINTEFESMPRS